LNTPARILVVDDQPINVRLIERKLEKSGMEVHTAFDGQTAIDKANEVHPDVILLDIMMPGMDGLEVCAALKDKAATRNIPIIFITAKTSKEGKLAGLGVGAADYITKPIDLDETLARIRTQLSIQQNHKENLELAERLAEMRRQAAVAYMTEGIAHNLNNILGVVVGYVELLGTALNDPERAEHCCAQIQTAVKRMVRIVSQLTQVADFKNVKKKPLIIDDVLQRAVARFREDYKVEAIVDIINRTAGLEFHTNEEMIEDLLGRLLINAYESYEGTKNPERPVRLIAETTLHHDLRILRIMVEDDGRGIPEDIRDNVFDPFVTTINTVGRGMGLTIARHSIRSLGGRMRLEDRKPRGIRAIVDHPIRPEDEGHIL